MTNLDICNTSYGQKKVKSQTSNLTSDHKQLEIDPTSMRVDGVQYTLGKLLMRATILLWTSSQSEV